ncbi:MAG: hypothetical protein H6907_07965 [Hyphomicrobiales bacterium]|nr:hypothetical protein [Hyphomicrobiales bacterium]MCP5371655.1 hypothetical protein [Hyphomicrobiales bacterium]
MASPSHTPTPTLDQLKAEARALRAEGAAGGAPLTHARALEAVARRHGFRDWNVAAARLSNRPQCPVNLGDRVAGRYLKQAFAGTVIGVQALSGSGPWRVTVHFDDPVDVVTFDSFSAFRQRVTCVVDGDGRALARTGDGVPHMVLDL